MDWADDVAYSVHDLEDGVEAGLIKLDHLSDAAVGTTSSRWRPSNTCADADEAELEQGVRDLIALPWWPTSHDGGLNSLAALKNLTSQLIGRFCQSAEAATREVYGRGPLTRYDADLVVPRPARVECALLKAVTAHYVMNRAGVEVIRSRQRTVLLELVDQLWNQGGEAFEPLFRAAWAAAPDDDARRRVVIDQVASLTDTSAVIWHRRGTHDDSATPSDDPA